MATKKQRHKNRTAQGGTSNTSTVSTKNSSNSSTNSATSSTKTSASTRSSNWYRLLIALIGTAAVLFNIASVEKAQAKVAQVIAYVPEYRVDHVVNHMPFFAAHVTELVLFSATVMDDGSIALGDQAPGIHPDQIRGVVAAAREHGSMKVLLTVGGGGRSGAFGSVTSSPQLRQSFAKALVSLCKTYNLDGIDFDWEGPGNKKQMLNYEETMATVKRYMAPNGLILTVALHYWQSMSAVGNGAVDRVHLMAYDMIQKQGEGHSTIENSKAAAWSFLSKGLHASKLALGIPLYARAMNDPQQVKTYEELLRDGTVADGDVIVKDDVEWWINTKNTVETKANWAAENGLAGVMLWELGQDSVDPQHSITLAVARALANETQSIEHGTKRDEL